MPTVPAPVEQNVAQEKHTQDGQSHMKFWATNLKWAIGAVSILAHSLSLTLSFSYMTISHLFLFPQTSSTFFSILTPSCWMN